jgi:hypothetical protein
MGVVAVKHAQFLVIHADSGRVWQLLLSPAMWSMRTPTFMFDVPGAGQLRFWIGSDGSGFPLTGLYELAVDDNAKVMTFQHPPPSRNYIRLSMRTTLRGVKVRVETVAYVPADRARAVERTHARFFNVWLHGIRAVAEGYQPEPAETIPASVADRCLQVPPQPADWISVTHEAVIRADPVDVWTAVYAPHFELRSGQTPVACGIVPGTPVGERGEIQYFIWRNDDGSLRSSALATSAILDGLGAVTHRLRPPYDQVRYRVFAGDGLARLEISWSGPAGIMTDAVAAELRTIVEHHKSALEQGDKGHPDEPTDKFAGDD